jgi:hypothetical protein
MLNVSSIENRVKTATAPGGNRITSSVETVLLRNKIKSVGICMHSRCIHKENDALLRILQYEEWRCPALR